MDGYRKEAAAILRAAYSYVRDPSLGHFERLEAAVNKLQAIEEMEKFEAGFGIEDYAPRVNGSSFRCGCGSQVFRKQKDSLVFRCAECQEVYLGEIDEQNLSGVRR